MNSSELYFVKAIHSIANKCYGNSVEPLHPCERNGGSGNPSWLKVKMYAEALIELSKEENNG